MAKIDLSLFLPKSGIQGEKWRSRGGAPPGLRGMGRRRPLSIALGDKGGRAHSSGFALSTLVFLMRAL